MGKLPRNMKQTTDQPDVTHLDIISSERDVTAPDILSSVRDVTTPDILSSVRVVSSTKDSVHVKWTVYDVLASKVQGYQIRYQATGSRVLQTSQRLPGYQQDYDIKHLHEDTSYEVCIDVFTHNTTISDSCIHATTKTDSLHVALASAFGAFLVFGIIVAFVFLAKWQHSKRRKRLNKLSTNEEACDGLDLQDVDYLSELSMRVNESQPKMSELDSQSDCDIQNVNSIAIGCGLSDCSEEPISYHSNSYLPESYHSSQYLAGSRERCWHCECELSDSQSARSLRSKYSRAKSVESNRSALSKQHSVDAYGSRRKLPKQYSEDLTRRDLNVDRSHDSGLYSFPRHKSHDSDISDYSPRTGARTNHKRRHKRHHDSNKDVGQSSQSNLAGDNHKRSNNCSASPANSQLLGIPVSTQPNTSSLLIAMEENSSSTSINSSLINQDGRPPDVRPKEPVLRHNHYPALAKQKTIQDEIENSDVELAPVNDGGHCNSMRYNTSCPNW